LSGFWCGASRALQHTNLFWPGGHLAPISQIADTGTKSAGNLIQMSGTKDSGIFFSSNSSCSSSASSTRSTASSNEAGTGHSVRRSRSGARFYRDSIPPPDLSGLSGAGSYREASKSEATLTADATMAFCSAGGSGGGTGGDCSDEDDNNAEWFDVRGDDDLSLVGSDDDDDGSNGNELGDDGAWGFEATDQGDKVVAAAAAAAAAKLEALVRALNPIFNGASAKKGGFLFSVHAGLCLEIQ